MYKKTILFLIIIIIRKIKILLTSQIFNLFIFKQILRNTIKIEY